MAEKGITKSIDYEALLRQAVNVLEQARKSISRHIAHSVNGAYWEIGKIIHKQKLDSRHGAGVVRRLSDDLKQRYPSMGLSPRQLWNMKKFYLRFFRSEIKLLQAVAVLPWGHNLLLMNKELSDEQTIFYAQEVIAKGWSCGMFKKLYICRKHRHTFLYGSSRS